jgi:predicted nucleotidyltransferase
MKNTLLALTFIFTSMYAGAQLAENKVDEFTKKSVKRTTWEKFIYSMKGTAFTRVSRIDSTILLNFKFSNTDVISIREGAKFMLKTSTDSIVTLNALDYTISCKGCGAINYVGSAAEGVEVTYPISIEQVNYLASNPVTKLRFYTTDGYLEFEIKEKFAKSLQDQLKLIL